MLQIDIDDVHRRLINALPDYALLLLDQEGHIVTWNAGAEVIKGYRAQDIIGKHIRVFYTPEAIAVGHPDASSSSLADGAVRRGRVAGPQGREPLLGTGPDLGDPQRRR